jgi:hypothetical protein
MCIANSISLALLATSSKTKIKSNLESKAAGRLIFLCGVYFLLYRPYNGLAAAKIEVLAFKLVVIPAFAIETVCCYITS